MSETQTIEIDLEALREEARADIARMKAVMDEAVANGLPLKEQIATEVVNAMYLSVEAGTVWLRAAGALGWTLPDDGQVPDSAEALRAAGEALYHELVDTRAALEGAMDGNRALVDSHLSEKTALVHRAIYDQVAAERDALAARANHVEAEATRLAVARDHLATACARKDDALKEAAWALRREDQEHLAAEALEEVGKR
jgi:hypothetical protein